MNFKNAKNKGKIVFLTLLTAAILFIFLSPFAFMVFTSLKTQEQITALGSPIWPAKVATFEYNGKELDVYNVPMNTCVGSEDSNATRDLAIVQKGLQESVFVDSGNLDRVSLAGAVSWRVLERPWELSPAWSNYSESLGCY